MSLDRMKMFVKRIASASTILIFTSISIFAYFYLSSYEHTEKQGYLDVQCIRKKNSTIAEVRGGNTVLLAMKNALSLVNLTRNPDRWINFTRELITTTNWKIVGGAALREMNRQELMQFAQFRNITPTERDENGGRRRISLERDRYLIIVEYYPNSDTIGYDYLSDPQRSRMVSAAYSTGNIAISNPGLSINGTLKTVVFFIPAMKDNKYIGGVSAAYYTSNLVPALAVNDDVLLQLAITDVRAFENDNFVKTNLRSTQYFTMADKRASLECGVLFERSFTPLVVLIAGILTGVAIALLISDAQASADR